MKKFLVAGLLTSFSFFLPRSVFAQSQQLVADCYNSYKKKGDNYNNLRNYDLAVQQYQAAKFCANLNKVQKKTLDSLIADIGKKTQLEVKKRAIIKRY